MIDNRRRTRPRIDVPDWIYVAESERCQRVWTGEFDCGKKIWCKGKSSLISIVQAVASFCDVPKSPFQTLVACFAPCGPRHYENSIAYCSGQSESAVQRQIRQAISLGYITPLRFIRSPDAAWKVVRVLGIPGIRGALDHLRADPKQLDFRKWDRRLDNAWILESDEGRRTATSTKNEPGAHSASTGKQIAHQFTPSAKQNAHFQGSKLLERGEQIDALPDRSDISNRTGHSNDRAVVDTLRAQVVAANRQALERAHIIWPDVLDELSHLPGLTPAEIRRVADWHSDAPKLHRPGRIVGELRNFLECSPSLNHLASTAEVPLNPRAEFERAKAAHRGEGL